MAGRNRFVPRGGRSILEKADRLASGSCVFISHQYGDTAAAVQIGDQLKALEIDIWLDAENVASQSAFASGDHEKLAQAIEWGLTNCTHLLALISPTTKGSWWVPFEVGSARGRGKPLVFFVHKEVKDLPAWLTLGRRLLDQKEFYAWAAEVSSDRALTESRAMVQKSASWSRLANLLPAVRFG